MEKPITGLKPKTNAAKSVLTYAEKKIKWYERNYKKMLHKNTQERQAKWAIENALIEAKKENAGLRKELKLYRDAFIVRLDDYFLLQKALKKSDLLKDRNLEEFLENQN